MIEFAGFLMPLWYDSIVNETLQVRRSVGIFDVSHMGRVIIEGEKADEYLNYLTTNDTAKLRPGQAHYSLMCNENGGIKDDIIVFRLDGRKFLVVLNAGNREKDLSWMKSHQEIFGVAVKDVSDIVAMFAVQGPNSPALLDRVAHPSVSQLPRFGMTETRIVDQPCRVSRTGYTGEDGFEVFVLEAPLDKPEAALEVWQKILHDNRDFIAPCGLGARDILRLEAGICLYGNDIDENTTPLEARLGFAVKFEKNRFIGRKSLLEQKEKGPSRVRVGIKLHEKGIPRAGFTIMKKGRRIGSLTSGSLSPTVNAGIGMGYVEQAFASEGEIVTVVIRDRIIEAEVAKFPLYDVTKYGWQRKN